MTFCCCKRNKVEVKNNLQSFKEKNLTHRDLETRSKFRCYFCGGKSCKHEN